MKEKGIVPILVILLVAILGTAFYFFLKPSSQSWRKICSRETKMCPDGTSIQRTGEDCVFVCPSPVATQHPIPSLVSKVTDSKAKSGWKIFSGDYYEISFPSSWTFGDRIFNDTGFPEAIELISPNKTSGIQIGSRYSFPFGIEGRQDITESKTTKTLNGVVFSGKVTTIANYDGEGCNNTFVILESNKTMSFDSYKGYGNFTEPLQILYGNGYPLQNVRASCESDFQIDEPIIDQILSSFKSVQ